MPAAVIVIQPLSATVYCVLLEIFFYSLLIHWKKLRPFCTHTVRQKYKMPAFKVEAAQRSGDVRRCYRCRTYVTQRGKFGCSVAFSPPKNCPKINRRPALRHRWRPKTLILFPSLLTAKK
jgi:hypothetical protein